MLDPVRDDEVVHDFVLDKDIGLGTIPPGVFGFHDDWFRDVAWRDFIWLAGRRGRGQKRLSDFPSDFVNYGSAQWGIVAASAKREAL